MKVDRREDIPKLLVKLGLNGIGMELGVWRGAYSEILLKESKLSVLYSIDAWSDKFTKKAWTQSHMDDAFELTTSILSTYQDRSKIIRMQSDEAVNMFEDEFFDFIYIDACHFYDFVRQDIDLWWSKLKKNGIFAGHDFCNPEEWGVIQAVEEHSRKYNLNIHITDKDYPPSWYCLKDQRKHIKYL